MVICDLRGDCLPMMHELHVTLPTGNYAVLSVNGATKQMAPTYMLPEGVSK